MPEQSGYSEEQLERLKEKLANIQEELHKEEVSAEKEAEKEAERDAFEGAYVRVDDENMTAWLYLKTPTNEDYIYQAKDVEDFLRSKGICGDIDESRIEEMLDQKLFEQEVEIAFGKPVVDGKDGYFEYNFSPEAHKSPKIRPDGSVDYTSMSMLQNVRAGDVLAVYHHAVQGEDGCTLYGRAIQAKIGRELPPMRGRNISNQENPDIYISTIDGKVELRDGRVDIQNIHEIMGDVDLVTGKIEFFGDIVINGNVEAGVVLRSGRNIVIHGTVEAVTMFAGGDIILERGVQGGQRAKLSARGNVFADFIEHSTVEAGGDIQANTIISSQISAEGKVILTGKKGCVIGGKSHGLLGVQAVGLGNKAEIQTVVHAGYTLETYKEFMRLSSNEQSIALKLKELVEEMSELLKLRREGELSKRAEMRLVELNQKKDELFNDLDSAKKDREFLKAIIERGKDSEIYVDGPIYRGVIVGVNDMRLPIENNTCYMRYRARDGMLEGSVIVK